MNLSDCKTIEEYRDAAHYWQKRWAASDKLLVQAGLVIASKDLQQPILNEISKHVSSSIGLDKTTII